MLKTFFFLRLIHNSYFFFQNLQPLPVEEIVEGGFCLTVSEDQEYYRALILGVEQTAETAHIVFIDYGDETDVAFNLVNDTLIAFTK